MMLAMKRKREATAMPPEYVKGPGKVGAGLHPHWRKSFPNDEEDAKGRGKVVEGLPGYGVWRRVPGFWGILASDLGYVMTEGDVRVRTPTVNCNHYLVVGCNGNMERVHMLVCRAFKGRPEPNEVSVDHTGGKTLPMAERRQDNRAVNLDWATAAQQNANRGEHKANSNGEPCLVWQVKGGKLKSSTTPYDMTRVEDTMRWFPSLNTAIKTLGLHPAGLSHVLNGKTKTVASPDGTRFTGKWDSDLVDLEGEEWKEKPVSSRNRLLVSNYGRLQWIWPGGREGTKHYPESSDPKGYLTVKIDRQNKFVHVLVGELFFIGPKPLNWACWDHKDLDKQHNHIVNIHPVTFEENQLNTAQQRDFYIWPVGEPDDWVRCVSQAATARAYGFTVSNLRSLLHKYMRDNGTVGGYCAEWCDVVEGR